MKTLLYSLLLTAFLGACQSKTYQQALTVNHLRFGTGLQKDNSIYLIESYDLVQFIEALSITAKEKSTLKESYLLADEAIKSTENLKDNFKFEAAIKRVKLSSVLSEPYNEYWQQLNEIPKDKFDMMYSQIMQTYVTKLVNKTNEYVDQGTDKRLIEFADEVGDCMRPTVKMLENEKGNSKNTSIL